MLPPYIPSLFLSSTQDAEAKCVEMVCETEKAQCQIHSMFFPPVALRVHLGVPVLPVYSMPPQDYSQIEGEHQVREAHFKLSVGILIPIS